MLQFVLFLCYIAAIVGFMIVAWTLSWYQAGRLLSTAGERRLAAPQWPNNWCPQASSEPRPPIKLSHTLTGRAVIDAQLQEALQYGMRDFVQSWYHVWVSTNSGFPDEVQRAIITMATDLAIRCSEADIATLLSQTVLEECLVHLQRCKEATSLAGDGETEGCLGKCVLASLPDDDPWTAVCLQPHTQRVYFQGVSDLLLHIMLPGEEFSSPPLHLFLRDMLTQQVWLPLLKTISAPDFINVTLISLLKEFSLNSESFLAALRTPSSQAEVERIRTFVAMEMDRLKSRGVSGTDKQRLVSLDIVMTTIEKQLDGELEEGLEELESSLPLSISITVPSYAVERGHVTYAVDVQCRHSGVELVESWTTLRRFSDFHDLHMTLRNTLGSLPSFLSLPSSRTIKKLDPAFLDGRRRGLETYLQTLVSDGVLLRYPQALPIVSLFIADETYHRSSNEFNRQVNRFLHPFRKMPSKQTVTTTTTNNKVMSSSPLLLRRQQRINNQDGSEEDDQDLDLLLRLLDELFDLRDHGQWLRRQLARMLSQLLGDRVSRKVSEGVAWLTSPEQISQYCRDLTYTIWPGGIRPSRTDRDEGWEGDGEGEGGEGVQMLRSVLARAKLIGSVPDDLRRLLGARRTTHGMGRLGHLLQDESLNCWMCLQLFEASLQTLFPSHSLSPALRSLRQQLHSISR